MRAKVVVVGSSNTDMIVQVTHIPRPGETILGGAFTMAAGGKGANQAVAAARAGADVVFVARVGDDMFGHQAIEGFLADGIDATHVKRDKKNASGVALISVAADGENSIAVASGANAALSPKDVHAAKSEIASASIVLCQLETPIETIKTTVQLAADARVPVILNPAPAQQLPDDLLKQISILTPNETESQILTGVNVIDDATAQDAAKQLRDRGVQTVIVTRGPSGSLIVTEHGLERIAACPVQAVDTTAAGDVFNGALALAVAEGQPLDKAARFAAAAAAISVTRLGAQPSIPTRAEINLLISQQSKG